MKPHPLTVATCLAVLAGSPVFGAAAQPKIASIGVTIAEVTDIRSANGQPSECRLTLSLTGDAVADAYSIHQIHLTKAVDELGRDLIKVADATARSTDTFTFTPTPASEQQRLEAVAGEVARRREIREGAIGSASVLPVPMSTRAAKPAPRPVISVRNPSRQSPTIKLIEGEIELFTPTKENGGILALPGITAHPAEFVSHAALKDAGVQIMYLTPETYEAKRAALGTDPKNLTGPWQEAVANSIKSQARLPNAGRQTTLFFYIDDPKNQIVDLELQSADGKPLTGRGSGSLGQLRLIYSSQPPSPDAILSVRIASPRSLTTYPFKVENIALP